MGGIYLVPRTFCWHNPEAYSFMIIDYYNIINLSIKLTLEYDTYVVYFSFSGYTV